MSLDDLTFLSMLDVEDSLITLRVNQHLLVCLAREIDQAYNWANPELREVLDRLTTILNAYDNQSVTAALQKCSERLGVERRRTRMTKC